MAKDASNNKEIKNKKHFFKDFKAELKKVIWPTPKQIVNNTIAVITIVIITAVIVFALDTVFNLLNDKGINRIKENIKETAMLKEDEEREANDSEEFEDEDYEEDDLEDASQENAVNN